MAPSNSTQRDRVAKLALSYAEEALRLAREINDPWFRCQALALSAHGLKDGNMKSRAIQESFSVALATKDVNRKVSASSWPLKVLCKSGEHSKLTSELRRLLALAETEPSPVRRADALNLLSGAVVTGPRPLFREALAKLKAACLTPLENGKRNKKGESHLAQWAVIIHRMDAALAEDLLLCIKGPTLLKRVKQNLQEFKDLGVEDLCSWPNIG